MQKEQSVTNQKGFSVVEALLAAALLAIVVAAFTAAIIYGEESTQVAGGISRATFLAEEGIEAVKNIKDQSFGNLVDGSYGLAVSNNQWVFSGNSDTTDGFVRQINISDGADSNRKIVTATITWDETAQRSNAHITLTTELTNWKQ